MADRVPVNSQSREQEVDTGARLSGRAVFSLTHATAGKHLDYQERGNSPVAAPFIIYSNSALLLQNLQRKNDLILPYAS